MQASPDRNIPPLFLTQGFSFNIQRQDFVHERVDRGVIHALIDEISEIDDPKQLVSWLVDLLVFNPVGANKKEIRSYVIEKFGFAPGDNVTLPESREKIARALEKFSDFSKVLKEIYSLFSKRALSSVSRKILLILSYYSAEGQNIRVKVQDYQRAAESNKVSSSLIRETIEELHLFYSQLLPQTFEQLEEVDTKKSLPRVISKAQRQLEEQKELAVLAKGKVATAEFIPSKTRSDQYFGFFCEDCFKENGEEIFKPNFQIYRMIIDGQLEGGVQVYSEEYENERALILFIEPRERLKIDYHELLKRIQQAFGKIAENEGYDYVLISTRPAEQSSRVDLLEAIEEGGYETIEFLNPSSPLFPLFLTRDYFVLYDRTKSVPKTDEITFLERNPDTEKWIKVDSEVEGGTESSSSDAVMVGGKGDVFGDRLSVIGDPADVGAQQPAQKRAPSVDSPPPDADPSGDDSSKAFSGSMISAESITIVDGGYALSSLPRVTHAEQGSSILYQENDLLSPVLGSRSNDLRGAGMTDEAGMTSVPQNWNTLLLEAIAQSKKTDNTKATTYLELCSDEEAWQLFTSTKQLYKKLIQADLSDQTTQLSESETKPTLPQILQINAALQKGAKDEVVSLVDTIAPPPTMEQQGMQLMGANSQSSSMMKSSMLFKMGR